MKNKAKRLLQTLVILGCILLFISGYYGVYKANIPPQDAPPEVMEQWRAWHRTADAFFKWGAGLLAVGGLGLLVKWFKN